MSDSPTKETWVNLKAERPPGEGEYRIKNDTMQGVGYYSLAGWAVIGNWVGNITHWMEKPTCH